MSTNHQSREAEFTNKLFSAVRTATSLGEKGETCNEHGEFTSAGMNYFGMKDIWSKCPTCEKIKQEKEDAIEKEKRAEARMREFKRILGLVGVPKRFEDCSFDNYRAETEAQKKCLNVCKNYAENFSKYKDHGDGLVMLGNLGNGKTHLAIAILKEVMKTNSVVYATVGDLIFSIRETWGKPEETRRAQQIYRSVDLLILDEVGVQTGSENEQQILFNILNHRYNERRTTTILSNCPARTYNEGGVQVLGVSEYLGERIFDRLTQISQVLNLQ